MFKIAWIIAALCASSAVSAANLVTNGDFEAGNSGFTSDYSYSPGGNSTEGQYTVSANPSGWNGAFLSRGDHTSGSGLMYVGNGAPNAGDIVWKSGSIALTSNTLYFFEAFVMNVCCIPSYTGGNSDPILTFRISLDGAPSVDLATRTLPASQAGVWYGLSSNFNSGSATSVVLSLVNENTTRAGNDFALDDVTLGTRSVVNPIPEPATWALMIAGFGLVGAAARRKETLARARA
jgi:hypothetical protein